MDCNLLFPCPTVAPSIAQYSWFYGENAIKHVRTKVKPANRCAITIPSRRTKLYFTNYLNLNSIKRKRKYSHWRVEILMNCASLCMCCNYLYLNALCSRCVSELLPLDLYPIIAWGEMLYFTHCLRTSYDIRHILDKNVWLMAFRTSREVLLWKLVTPLRSLFLHAY